MTREENLHWLNQEIQTWENECQSKHPIKEALYAARKVLEQEPCEDAVSRKTIDQNIYDYAESNGLSYANLKNAILDAPSVTLTQKWIPVTERLPEESDDYLITNIEGDVEMAYFAHPKDYAISKGEWREICYEEDVIAWMPKPKPYKGGE